MKDYRIGLFAALALAAVSGAARAESLAEYGARASCIITPQNMFKLAMPAAGALAQVNVRRADRVAKGQIVAQLESGVEQSQVDAARVRAGTDVLVRLKTAVYAAAQAKVERQRALRLDKIASQQTLEDAESAAAVAKADVEQAQLDKQLAGFEVQRLEATLERRTLRSPADGVVTAVELHAGEFADPTSPVVTITEIDPLKVDVYLPASAYSLVNPGMRAMITPKETSGGAREAVVKTKDPQIDASSGLFLIELELPNADGAIPAGVRCGVAFSG